MLEIPLNNKAVTLIDDEDAEWALQFVWHLKPYRSRYGGVYTNYATRNLKIDVGRWTTRLLHRELMGASSLEQVDHRNRDGLDNRRSNLRIATSSQNCQNRRKQRNNTSGVTGVRWDSRSGKWTSYIYLKRKLISLGAYDRLEDAAAARSKAELKYHKEFARAK